MRAIWSGSISFGLINIPVTLYSASKDRVFDFHMLHKKDLGPISFLRVCRDDGKEIPYEEVVKGYEYREGDYVVLNPEDFKKASPKESDNIDILEFVDESEIPGKYYKKPYYLEPVKGSGKAYVLLREALKATNKAAIGKIILRDRQDLVVLRSDGNLLSLNQLRFYDEIRDATELAIPKKVEVSRQEVEMAVKLIKSMQGKFSPKEYRDTYTQKLEKLIEAKAHGRKVKSIPTTKKSTAPADLVAQLKASLAQHS